MEKKREWEFNGLRKDDHLYPCACVSGFARTRRNLVERFAQLRVFKLNTLITLTYSEERNQRENTRLRNVFKMNTLITLTYSELVAHDNGL